MGQSFCLVYPCVRKRVRKCFSHWPHYLSLFFYPLIHALFFNSSCRVSMASYLRVYVICMFDSKMKHLIARFPRLILRGQGQRHERAIASSPLSPLSSHTIHLFSIFRIGQVKKQEREGSNGLLWFSYRRRAVHCERAAKYCVCEWCECASVYVRWEKLLHSCTSVWIETLSGKEHLCLSLPLFHIGPPPLQPPSPPPPHASSTSLNFYYGRRESYLLFLSLSCFLLFIAFIQLIIESINRLIDPHHWFFNPLIHHHFISYNLST